MYAHTLANGAHFILTKRGGVFRSMWRQDADAKPFLTYQEANVLQSCFTHQEVNGTQPC